MVNRFCEFQFCRPNQSCYSFLCHIASQQAASHPASRPASQPAASQPAASQPTASQLASQPASELRDQDPYMQVLCSLLVPFQSARQRPKLLTKVGSVPRSVAAKQRRNRKKKVSPLLTPPALQVVQNRITRAHREVCEHGVVGHLQCYQVALS